MDDYDEDYNRELDGEDVDEFDMYDDADDDEELDKDDDFEDKLREAELKGYDDGYLDAENNVDMYQGYGISVDEDELTDAEKEAYEAGYLDGFQSH